LGVPRRAPANGFVKLKKTKFKTVFANDILLDARNAWVNYFSKKGHNEEDFYKETIMQTSAFELSEYWETKTTDKTKLFNWIDSVSEHAKKIQDAKHLNIKQILTELALK
jgi:hypothetical protein